jgi:hypothetical protein
MQEDQSVRREESRGLLGRFSRRQLRLAGLLTVLVIVVVVVGAVLLARRSGAPSAEDVERRLMVEIAAVADSAGGGSLDLVKLNERLEQVRGSWVLNLAASDDRRTVGVAARQPDGTTCLFVWSAVGGAKSAVVTDPNLPCRGEIALIAAR